jgi:predicted NAD/FAD-binding protein
VITDASGTTERFDHVVFATHADQALGMLSDPSPDETALLGAFQYTRNETILHTDASLMPKRKAVWSSWNYLARTGDGASAPCVTYWMNRLQSIPENNPLFVTLNPVKPPRPDTVIRTELYEHPVFDEAAIRAQRRIWQLQGRRNSWFCGAYFGSGFHEDGLQAGLAVAEALGGVRRPWTVPNESGRIHLDLPAAA